MIGGDDDEGVGVAFLEFEAGVERLIQRDLVVQRGGGVGVVRGVVDARAFDLEDEFLAALQPREGGAGQLDERRDGVAQLRIGAVVEGVGQVAVGEGAEQPRVERGLCQRGFVAHHGVAGGGELAAQVALVLASFAVEEGASTAEEDIDFPLEILRGDGVGVAARFHRDGESGRRGVGDLRSGDEPRLPPRIGEERVEGREQPAIREDVHRAIHHARTAAPRAGRGGAVGDGGIQRARVHQRETRGGVAEKLHPRERALAGELGEDVGAGERAAAHAIADDVDNALRLLPRLRDERIRGARDMRCACDSCGGGSEAGAGEEGTSGEHSP